MKKRASGFPLGRWVTLCAVVAGLLLVFQYSSVPSRAQEQKPAAGQPSEVKPEAPQPAQPSGAKPEPKAEEKKPPTEERAEAAKKEEPEALDNDSCMDCHTSDILKQTPEELAENVVVADKPQPPAKKPPYLFGELSLAISMKKFKEGVHAETPCVDCHQDVKEIPHAQRLARVDCKQCHEEAVELTAASAHGKKAGPKEPGCIGCHDVHYGKGSDAYVKGWKEKYCVDCHGKYGMDTVAGHAKIYAPKRHLALGCLTCHQGEQPGVHNITPVKTKVASCQACHTKYTILAKKKMEPVSCWDYIKQVGFINKEVLAKFGYVVGAHRVPALDTLLILVVIGPLALPIFHGGLRILTRRKGPIELPEEKILLHPLIERLWHWAQAVCIVVLIITGIMIHWPEKFGGWFQWAVDIHEWFGWATVVVFLVWLVYNLGTKRITHYIPKKGEIPKGMITQAKFYGYGIFKHEPHPYAPSEDNKFNPLQKIAYLQFQVLLMPLLLISGLLYMYPDYFQGFIKAIGGMVVLATIHYILGALFTAFLVAHLYLATTGETIGENFKAIIFGYGTKSDHHHHA
jgi:thiosulfate reductase cytochrome b subunit